MMFKEKYWFKTICLLMVLFSAASCNKWLDLKPSDGIIREDYWKTKEQVKAAVIGMYASLLDDPTGKDKSLSELFFLWGELRADMLAPSTGTVNEEYQVMNVNTVPSNSLVNWRPVYRTINYCNTIIDFAPDVLKSDKTLTQGALDAYVAEAKALRALMYFYLVRSFGEVPLKLKSTSSDDEIVTIAKSSQEEVLNQIIKDLNEAEPKILLTYGDQASDKGRLTRYSVNAIQADVYLWMDKYDESIAACNKVINSYRFGLVSASSAWYNVVYRSGNSTESIFEFQYNAQKLNDFFIMFGITSKRFVAANKVMDQVYTSDPIYNLKDIRADGASVLAEDGTIWKYIGKNNLDLIAPGDSYSHWFVYRFADILLMKAEALAQKGEGAEALEIVRTLRGNRNALIATDNNPDPANIDEVSLFILEERSREFMFEGKRWYDILRYVKRNNYEHIDYLLDMVASIVPANMVHTAQAKMLDHNSHYFPIYDYELQTNKALVQNTFYK